MHDAIIIEDNHRDREILSALLAKYCGKEINIIESVSNLNDAYKLIIKKKPDIIFLDIELGNESGFELLQKFTNYTFKVIFVTGFSKYALRAIKFNALDYLLKPIEINELVEAVKKVVTYEQVNIDNKLKNLIVNFTAPNNKKNKIAIPVVNGLKMITVSDIIYFEANKEYSNIHCIANSVVYSSTNLGEYEEMLEDYDFCRVHHSFLVNKEYVKHYIKGEGGEILTDNGSIIPVSRRNKTMVVNWLKNIRNSK
jgi:two-component system, LytTR family, response regulator